MNTRADNDLLLLKLLREDDEIAFRELFEKYYVPLSRFVNHYVRAESVAEEIALDIFWYVWENRATINITTSFKSYIFRAAHNRSISYLQRQKNTTSLDRLAEEGIACAERPDEMFELQGMEVLVMEAVMSLPPQCMVIYKKSREENLSNKEIARQMNISVKAVEKQITKALRIIRERIGENMYMLF